MKSKIKKEIKNYLDVNDYQQGYVTPESDSAMVKYLLDSIAWLDEMEDI
jgi:hypothetical protein